MNLGMSEVEIEESLIKEIKANDLLNEKNEGSLRQCLYEGVSQRISAFPEAFMTRSCTLTTEHTGISGQWVSCDKIKKERR